MNRHERHDLLLIIAAALVVVGILLLVNAPGARP